MTVKASMEDNESRDFMWLTIMNNALTWKVLQKRNR